MLDYFEEYYIGLKLNNKSENRKVPMFPIQFWNMNSRTKLGDPRTNNSVEAWHSAFTNDCNPHSALNIFVKKILDEQDKVDNEWPQLIRVGELDLKTKKG